MDTFEEVDGTVVFDLAHGNAFDIDELNVLISRLVARGLMIELLTEGDDLGKELLGDEDIGEEPLTMAYVVVCPQNDYSKEDRVTVDKFVENSGKLLLIADPTRPSRVASLSFRFGLVFESGYLYNLQDNDANYRNIFITEFKESEITKDIGKIALYTAGAITSVESGIAYVDENTLSSLIETRTRLSPIALASDSRVLGIYDLTFMTEPYNGILDNNRLISNIANWLASPVMEQVEMSED